MGGGAEMGIKSSGVIWENSSLYDADGEEILEEVAGPYRATSQRRPSIRNLPFVHQSGASVFAGVDGGQEADDEDATERRRRRRSTG